MVATLSKLPYCGGLLFWVIPGHFIHSGSLFAVIFCHSPDSKRLAAKRVGEKTLKGFDLSPSSLLCRLHDTGLEPTHIGLGCLPIDVMPSLHNVGSCTSLFNRHLLCLLYWFSKRSRDERPGGSLLAFAWDDVAGAQSLSPPLQESLRFLHLPLPARSSVFLTVHLPSRGGYGFTVFRLRSRVG